MGEFPTQDFLWQANTDTLQQGNFSGKCVTCYNRPIVEGIKLEKGSAVSLFVINT